MFEIKGKVTDRLCPNIVGVDIGCGMYTVYNFKSAEDAAPWKKKKRDA